MVWDTEQSTLYTLSGAVERHNADIGSETTEYADIAREEPGEPADSAYETDGSPAAGGEPLPKRYGQHDGERRSPEPIRAETERAAPCEKCAGAPAETECSPPCTGCPRLCPKCGKPLPAHKPLMLDALLADKDTLLLAALILLLWHEKADMKLIGALAFILLSN